MRIYLLVWEREKEKAVCVIQLSIRYKERKVVLASLASAQHYCQHLALEILIWVTSFSGPLLRTITSSLVSLYIYLCCISYTKSSVNAFVSINLQESKAKKALRISSHSDNQKKMHYFLCDSSLFLVYYDPKRQMSHWYCSDSKIFT